MALVKQKITQPQTVAVDERTTPRDFHGLCEELNSDNPNAQRWAVRDLLSHPNASKPLAARLEIEDQTSVRTALLDALASICDETSIAALVQCLRSDDAALRNEAIDVLKTVPEQVATMMNSLLHDEDSDVRIFAVNILESLRHAYVEKWLIEVIESDPHINVCATAVDLLSEVGTEIAALPLEKLKKRFANEPYICFTVDLALKRIKGD